MKELYIVLLCNKKYFLLLLNKDTLKNRKYAQILPNPEVNATGRDVAQSNAKLL